MVSPDHEVVVIGAGPGGIAAAILLRQAGITDLTILERGDGVGGSWRDNTYPGIGVDIPSIAYQYSFARKPDWSRVFAKGEEVLAYHQDVAERYGLMPLLRPDTEVVREIWDEEHELWRLTTATGDEVTARFVVSAVGAFLRAKADPGIPGLDTFAGAIQRPDAWDHDVELRGKRVAVIGTGASAVQIVPAIAREVSRLDVYQRTPVWCLPKLDAKVPGWMKTALRVPGVAAGLHGLNLLSVEATLRAFTQTPDAIGRPAMRAFDRAAKAGYRRLLNAKVDDPATRAALMPGYGPFTKRPTMSNHFLTAFNADHVGLITEPIARITADGIETADGTVRAADVLVLATGYELFSDPESYRPGTIVGRDGFDLATFYAEQRLQAYESVAVPGLPNRWMVVGPYSWTGTGWHALVELNAHHITRAIVAARERGATCVEVRQDAHDAYHADVRRRGRLINWYFTELNGHVRTYYVNSQGDAPYIRPASLLQARRRSTRFPLSDYRYESEREMIMRCTSLVPS
ncbi:MAG: NAD(P)/FAD-dependent oxidoreductase [Solirubrobacteraceae bacterium]|nr:NAD(P)/FAD-dependent oxidoreductase [Solirubrobacteraceae bacterium]